MQVYEYFEFSNFFASSRLIYLKCGVVGRLGLQPLMLVWFFSSLAYLLLLLSFGNPVFFTCILPADVIRVVQMGKLLYVYLPMHVLVYV